MYMFSGLFGLQRKTKLQHRKKYFQIKNFKVTESRKDAKPKEYYSKSSSLIRPSMDGIHLRWIFESNNMGVGVGNVSSHSFKSFFENVSRSAKCCPSSGKRLVNKGLFVGQPLYIFGNHNT